VEPEHLEVGPRHPAKDDPLAGVLEQPWVDDELLALPAHPDPVPSEGGEQGGEVAGCSSSHRDTSSQKGLISKCGRRVVVERVCSHTTVELQEHRLYTL
jgi:hypothetical protein